MNMLFFVGNKRCGTTLVNNLLNLHKNIYIPHEADIINWALGTCSEEDGVDGLEKTKTLLGEPPAQPDRNSVLSALFNLKQKDPIAKEKEICTTGDKKPIQHLKDPVRSFVEKEFPSAKYIHVIRHPFGFLNSVNSLEARFASKIFPTKLSDYELLEKWAERVNEASKFAKTIRCEDVVFETNKTMKDLMEWLGLEWSGFTDRIQISIHRFNKHKKIENVPDIVKTICKKYDYRI